MPSLPECLARRARGQLGREAAPSSSYLELRRVTRCVPGPPPPGPPQPGGWPQRRGLQGGVAPGARARSCREVGCAFTCRTEEFKKRQAQDHLQENLRFMKRTRVTADPKVTTKVLLQNRGRKARDRPATKPVKEKPQGTVFTEEDFRKFQEEYFGSSGTK
uniref:Active regulator of SIRT1 n=1 Tax=Vombatus ursinus TaxID=29139 RepID=A0A4X2K382_VOMUR